MSTLDAKQHITSYCIILHYATLWFCSALNTQEPPDAGLKEDFHLLFLCKFLLQEKKELLKHQIKHNGS